MTLEYEVHGKLLKTGVGYDNRFVSVAFITNRKIVRRHDYMDSLAAWTAPAVDVRPPVQDCARLDGLNSRPPF